MVRGLCVAWSVCKCVTCLCESLCVSQSLMPRCQGWHEGAEVYDIVQGPVVLRVGSGRLWLCCICLTVMRHCSIC